LKGVFDPGRNDFVFRIADACLDYGYEYLGNGARLVITPLTDRIYVTATQALHLKMGCAPAGPAGTGKTESTKDLASALGKAVYVFNCSDQMDYQGMAGIFKGLAASGSWGCFDEFNRLVPEVLSVCSVQFKSVTDAIKAGKTRFTIQGDEISLDPSCGAFITMNPGYLGRSELPEGLKALFRPITVVVPDLELICENMLMAEGFVTAKALAKKFTTLYFLCRDLLSKAAHYDWGLRAIKSVLVVAGVMKRAEPALAESAILLRALRDFNIPKIVADDLDIFFGLLGDLFPGIDVPRKRDERFEQIVEDCAKEANLNCDPDFILKIVQLGELLEIRHCVFTMGPPGAGKSSTWKMLAKAQDKDGKKTTVVDLNPKVTSTNELYGVVLLATREWKDGLLSKTLRTLGQFTDTNPKWVILDGDLDANWIESMNSVMDDNKLLTLASNERIPLKPHMKMIFEIRDLRFATPATVSRAGILYISDSAGTQWRSYVKSWIGQLKCDDPMKTDLQ
jgi:dynein heavy chain